MAKTTNMRVSSPKPLTINPFPGDKRPNLYPDIHFYKVEDYDKSGSGDNAVTHIKIEKSILDTK